MTQEQKDLLLKDLCARLPYGVKFKYDNRPEICKILSITPIYNYGNVVYFDDYINCPKKCSIDSVKPYLFPLESMTEGQKEEYYGTFSLSGDFSGTVDFYKKHHFDWRGLIPMGLALDATGKNIY